MVGKQVLPFIIVFAVLFAQQASVGSSVQRQSAAVIW